MNLGQKPFSDLRPRCLICGVLEKRTNPPFIHGHCFRCYEEHVSIDEKDMVNSPSHYTTGKYEVIDIIEDNLKEGFEPYCIGNILKYVMRYKDKNGVEDLKKARWYLNRLIDAKEKGAE